MGIQTLQQRLRIWILTSVKQLSILAADPKIQGKFLIVLGCSTFSILNLIYDYNGNGSLWFFGNAFAFACYALALHVLLKSTVTIILCAITANQLVDEIQGIAEKGNILEYLAAFIIIAYWIRKKTQKK